MNIFEIKDQCRANLNIYLHQVVSQIPPIKGGHLLDMGCGSGVSSRKIVQTTDYMVTAMDIDDASLDHFRQKISGMDDAHRIEIMHGTLETAIKNKMKFDIVLAEGLFNIIGFKHGLRMTCALLKDGGYLVLHDGQDMMERKRTLINLFGFDVRKTLELDESVWGEAYCKCLERKIANVNERDLSPNEKAHFAQIQADIRLFHHSPQSFRSIYYLLKKFLR